MNKIFQIGFNKCGTSSLHTLFNEYTVPKINSVHWDYGKLALSMINNLINKKPLLSDYNDFYFFSDMETYIYDNNIYSLYFLFKSFDILDREYPNSKFILNTRSINKWIISRLNHINEYRITNGVVESIKHGEHYFISHMEFYKTDELSKIVSIWTDEWYEHHNKVINYFKDRPDDLLIFNIETDNIDKIKKFFPEIVFNTNILPMINSRNYFNEKSL